MLEDDKEEHAHEKVTKVVVLMKKNVMKRVGNNKICEVEEVVYVPLKDIDKVKVDTGNLTGVTVQVDKALSQAR